MNEISNTNVNTDNLFPITLPSLGVPYNGKIPGGKLFLKPITTKEEGILYSPSGNPTEKLSLILNRCVTEHNANELIITDRMWVMLVLRTRSLGGDYTFTVKCDICNTPFKHNMNISEDIKVKNMDTSIVEPVPFKLPVSGVSIGYRFLRGYDEKNIAQFSKRNLMQSSDPADPSYIYRMALMIQTIEGEEIDTKTKQDFVERLEMGDSVAFRNDVDSKESGANLELNVECRNCGNVIETFMPFTAEFFRPKSRRF